MWSLNYKKNKMAEKLTETGFKVDKKFNLPARMNCKRIDIHLHTERINVTYSKEVYNNEKEVIVNSSDENPKYQLRNQKEIRQLERNEQGVVILDENGEPKEKIVKEAKLEFDAWYDLVIKVKGENGEFSEEMKLGDFILKETHSRMWREQGMEDVEYI